MATIGSLAVADLTSSALDYFVRGPVMSQTMQEKPLLKFLASTKKTFPSGKQYISEPVQGAYMSDTSGFLQGYTQDTALTFAQANNELRVQYQWYELHAGFVITHTELKKGGISVTDGAGTKTSDHSDAMANLIPLLENRLADFAESWARTKNEMYWKDGSQDSLQVPGVQSLLREDPTTGTVGSLSQATYTWWRSRASLALSPSAENQTLTKFLSLEVQFLKKRGGRPNKILCGSAFWNALMEEVRAKGIYTQSGFTGKTDIGQGEIAITGIGTFEWDPTLDDLGLAKECFVFDSRRISLRPMQGEDNRTLEPTRPYQYMVVLKSMVCTEALQATQLNAMGRYRIA